MASTMNESRFSNGSNAYSQYQYSEEILERYNQASHSFQLFSMVLLMAFSLIPSLIMLGGFKFVIYMALERDGTVEPEDSLDINLTVYGIIGAFLLFVGRQFASWIARKQVVQAQNLLRFVLLL